jgi:hypothetical protein
LAESTEPAKAASAAAESCPAGSVAAGATIVVIVVITALVAPFAARRTRARATHVEGRSRTEAPARSAKIR